MPILFWKKPAPPPATAPVCRIDFELSDDRSAISQLLKRSIPFLGNNRSKDPHIDLSSVQYLGPFAASILLADHLSGITAGHQHQIVLPTHVKVGGFLQFSGLQHFLNGAPLPDANHPENATVPLRVVRKATWNAADPVIDLVHRYAVISEDDEIYLRNTINEVIQNVEDHAQSTIGAVYCARYLLKPAKIRVGIVDRGLGIGSTLATRHPEISNADAALRKVVQGGVSAKSRPNNLGLGISNLWGHVTKPLGGEIFIITEDVIGYSDRSGNLRTESLGARFAGTGVFFTVPVVR